MKPYEPTNSASAALHAPDWHAACPEVDLVDVAGRPFAWCRRCRCMVSLEAVAVKVHPASTALPYVQVATQETR